MFFKNVEDECASTNARGECFAKVFDEGNFVAIGYHEVSSNFVGHRLRRHHNVLCHPLRG
jgi:hypothetical protein